MNEMIHVFYEWNDTRVLTMIGGQLYEGKKVSLSEKWMVNYTTSGFPFIRGFPSHEWNKIRPLTICAGLLH